MDKGKIQDPGFFYILGKLERYGHEKLPLAIIKEKQSYVIGHKRKRFPDGSDYLEEACKITFVKKTNKWKLYWKRADLKWHLYEQYDTLDAALEEIKQDPRGCFWG